MLADLVFAAGVVVAAGWIALWVIELSHAEEVRMLPRWTWALLCVFCVPAGAIAYLIAGRVWAAAWPARRCGSRAGEAEHEPVLDDRGGDFEPQARRVTSTVTRMSPPEGP